MAHRERLSRTQREVETLERELASLQHRHVNVSTQLARFRTLYDLALALNTDQDLQEKLQLIVDRCRTVLEADLSYIALKDESRETYVKHAYSGIQTDAFRNLQAKCGMGLGGMVMARGVACAVSDYLEEVVLDDPTRAAAMAEGIVSGMAVPLKVMSKDLGLLYVFNRTRTEFLKADLETLSLIGHLGAAEIFRHQSERSLRESEERFRFMAETTGDVIYRLQYNTMRYDYLSPGIVNLTGYLPEEINEVGFARLVKRIDLPDREDVAPQVLVKDRLAGVVDEYRADYLIQTRSGQIRWLRDHSFPWIGENGEVVGSVGILSDITAYKRSEMLVKERTAELIESEEKYRTLVENVPLIVYRMNAGGEIVFVNRFVEQILGYSPVEILSSPQLWERAIYKEDRSKVRELRRQTYRSGKELVAEYRLVHKDGRIYSIIDHAIPIHGARGEVSGLNGIIVDISWRVKMQEQLVKAEGVKTIEAISSRLAHEIRNPLTAAGGFARRILESMDPEDPNRAKAAIVVKEVGRLEVILKMILNYIQPLDLQIRTVNLHKLQETVVGTLQDEAGSRGIKINLNLRGQPPDVAVDPNLFSQALRAVLLFAVNQSQNGGFLYLDTSLGLGSVELLIRCKAEELSQEEIDHLFLPFAASGRDKGEIDLPMAKVIVNKHGGNLDAKFGLSQELLMRISLPRYRESTPPFFFTNI